MKSNLSKFNLRSQGSYLACSYLIATVHSDTPMKYVERRFAEPVKFLFMSEMGLLGSHNSTKKIYSVPQTSYFFHIFIDKTQQTMHFLYL